MAEAIDQLLPELEIEIEYFERASGIGGPMQATGFGPSWSTSSPVGSEWTRTVLVRPSGAAALLYGLAVSQTLPQELTDVLPAVAIAAEDLAAAGGLPSDSPRFTTGAVQEMIGAVLADRLVAVDRTGQVDAVSARAVINRVLIHLERLAATRVEKRRLSHAVLIAASSTPARLSSAYPEVLGDLDRVPLIFDGEGAVLWIDENGVPIAELNDENLVGQPQSSWPPATSNLPVYREQLGDAGLAAAASDALDGLSFYLRSDGSIWVLADGVPFLFNRSGRWRGLAFTSLLSSLAALTGDPVTARLALDTALQLSMTGHGGILGITNSPQNLTVVPAEDRYDQIVAVATAVDASPKSAIHRLLDAQRLTARTLARLAAMDGASVITPPGDLVA